MNFFVLGFGSFGYNNAIVLNIYEHFDFGLHREKINLLPTGYRLVSVPPGWGLR